MLKLIGESIPRVEDQRLITGRGRFTDDALPADACAAFFVRSQHAHAEIRGIKTDAARAMSGVRAVLTAADYRADGHHPIHHHVNGPDAVDIKRLSFPPAPESPVFEQAQPPLAEDRVRFIGEIVAVVIADTLAQAKDAAEQVVVDYDELPAVVTPLQASAEGAPQIWSGLERNVCFTQEFGNKTATRRAFAEAAHIVRHDFNYQRIAACQMEPRASIGLFDTASGQYTLLAGSQGVVRHRLCLAHALGIDKAKVRVITQDVGGGFGARTSLNPEAVLVCWAARKVRRPVRWLGDRTEAFLGDYQGRDLAVRAALALDAKGRILGIEAEYFGNIGAHTVSFVSLSNAFRLISTVYSVPAAWTQVRAVMTNTVPTAPYRGAGRPETTYVVERLLDIAARRHGFDRIAIRRKNLISKAELPYRNPMGLTYDSGNFAGNMERALAVAEWKEFKARRAQSHKQGLLRGIGVANYVESPVGAINERIEVAVQPNGMVEITAGTQSTGQGHETVFAQVVGEHLGIPMERIKLVTGDTGRIEVGGGTHSDRTMRLGGLLLVECCGKLIEQARMIAARRLGCDPNNVRFEDGALSAPPSNVALSITECTEIAGAPLSAMAEIARRVPAYPTGCAVCELEVDPDTGDVQLLQYTSIDDVGQPINPMIVEGQVYGGIAMGIGEALYERFAVDRESGQVTSGSFMDYAMPRATCLPRFRIEFAEDPTSGNPLRVKGGGECGITPAPAAIVNALVDALAKFGIEDIPTPATSQEIWHAIRQAMHLARSTT